MSIFRQCGKHEVGNRTGHISRRTSIFAIAACVFGLLSFLPGVMVPAVLCAALALWQIGNGRGAWRGRRLAITGLVCAILLPAIGVILLPVIAFSQDVRGVHEQCISNQRNIVLAMNIYCTENEETMPGIPDLTPDATIAEKQRWRTDIEGVTQQQFNCPCKALSGAPGPETAEYAMNADLMGVGLGQIPLPVITVATADTEGTDAIFSAEDIAPRHNGGVIAAFVDGHVATYPEEDLPRDPVVTQLLTGKDTAAGYNFVGTPAINKIIIQGVTNVIDLKMTDQGRTTLTCFAYNGKRLATSINARQYRGTYITAYYSQIPENVTPRNITIGTFVNGYCDKYAAKPPVGTPPYGTRAVRTNIVMPAAACKLDRIATFWLPPVVGKSANRGHAPYTHYEMTGVNTRYVAITPSSAR